MADQIGKATPGKLTCEICGKTPSDGATIFRQNAPGEMPARWRCREHHDPRVVIDPVVLDITNVIEQREES